MHGVIPGGFKNIIYPAGWTPMSLSGLVTWWRSDVLTLSGSNVSTWDDQSGGGNHLTTSSAPEQPLYSANQLNGHASVIFNGTSNTMRTGNFLLSQPLTIYIVGKQITWSSGDTICDGTVDNSGRIFQNGSTPQLSTYSGAFGPSTTDLALNTFGLITAIFNDNSSVLQINNNTESTGDTNNTMMNGFVLGSFGTGAVAFSNIAICEVVIANVASSAADRLQFRTYVNSRYRITM